MCSVVSSFVLSQPCASRLSKYVSCDIPGSQNLCVYVVNKFMSEVHVVFPFPGHLTNLTSICSSLLRGICEAHGDWPAAWSHDSSHMIQSFPRVIHSGLDTSRVHIKILKSRPPIPKEIWNANIALRASVCMMHWCQSMVTGTGGFGFLAQHPLSQCQATG